MLAEVAIRLSDVPHESDTPDNRRDDPQSGLGSLVYTLSIRQKNTLKPDRSREKRERLGET
jgi:hypothetical protein